MSKSSAQKAYLPAVWIIALVVLVAAAVLGSTGSHLPIVSAPDLMAPAAHLQNTSAAQRAQVRARMGEMPLAFEANQGQADPQVRYTARGNGYSLFLTATDAVFALSSASHSGGARPGKFGWKASDRHSQTKKRVETAAIFMRLASGNSQSRIEPQRELSGTINYYVGNDPSKWQRGVKQYATVAYRDVYPGVDMAFHGEQKQLEFDYIVAPGASPEPIGLNFTGAKKIATDASGNLVLSTSAGDVVLNKPVAYQDIGGKREIVNATFQPKNRNEVALAVGPYDHSQRLVIDPSVEFATFLGGSAEDDGYAAAFDSFGNIYVTGQTASTNFPTAGGVSPNTSAGQFDVFVTKISPDGSTLVYSTYVGGTGDDSGNAIAVDALGNAFVAGGTTSSDFPHNGFQTSFGGGGVDGFVFELSSAGGALTYSTYLGGSGDDVANGIAIDGTDAAYVVGFTASLNFPTKNPIQGSLAGTSNGFVTKLSPAGALSYSTYLGGGGDSAAAVAVDSSGNAYVTGATTSPAFPTTAGAFQQSCGSDGNCDGGVDDAFVTVVNAAGSTLTYSTFLGGAGIDQGLGIAVDSAGDAYVTGLTQSADFSKKSPLQSTLGGIQDAFVAKLNHSGSALVYSTFLGGSVADSGTSIAVDENNNAYVTGQTASANFPKSTDATQPALGGGTDAFVSEIAASGSQLVFSTFLGGTANENINSSGGNLSAIGGIAVEKSGANIYVAGNTASTNFPTVSPKQGTYGGSTDAFVVRYNVSTAPDFQIAATTPGAAIQGGSGTSTVTLTSSNGYGHSVTLACSVTGSGSPLPSCTAGSAFSTNPVTPTSGGATSTLTITTTGAASAENRRSNIFYAAWLPVVGLPVVGLSLIGMRLGGAASRRKQVLGFMLLGIVVAALFFLPACGGGSSNGGGGGGGCSGCTPAGSYTVTITGTDASNLAHSTQVTLVVTAPLP